jgi:hypothetical protein
MTTTTLRNFARYIALPAISAGVIAGAALGFASTADANTGDHTTGPGSTSTTHPQLRPGIVASPDPSLQQPIDRFPSKRTERLGIYNHNYGG